MDTESPQRVDHALLIGIDRYQYIGPDLNGCVGDVEDMRDVLVSQLQTPADRVVLLRATHLQSEPPE
ncbi:MAG TPA: caspase family protein, partial [Isosphaeraceae bacterium]